MNLPYSASSAGWIIFSLHFGQTNALNKKLFLTIFAFCIFVLHFLHKMVLSKMSVVIFVFVNFLLGSWRCEEPVRGSHLSMSRITFKKTRLVERGMVCVLCTHLVYTRKIYYLNISVNEYILKNIIYRIF